MTQSAPPPFTQDQQKIVDAYRRLRTLVAGPRAAGLDRSNIADRLALREPGPSISGFSPSTGPVGVEVRISGTNLIRISETGPDSPINVFFGTTPADSFRSDGTSVVVAIVPQAAIPARVRLAVETDCGTAVSPDEFTVESSPAIP